MCVRARVCVCVIWDAAPENNGMERDSPPHMQTPQQYGDKWNGTKKKTWKIAAKSPSKACIPLDEHRWNVWRDSFS